MRKCQLQSKLMRKEAAMKGKRLFARVLITAVICCCCMPFSMNATKGYAAEPIMIGVSTDFSGITATFGVSQRGVWQMAVKELNVAGGINGRPVELIFLDNGADPARVLSTLKLLKEKHKVVAVLGGTSSTSCLPAKQWAETEHISFMNSMAAMAITGSASFITIPLGRFPLSLAQKATLPPAVEPFPVGNTKIFPFILLPSKS